MRRPSPHLPIPTSRPPAPHPTTPRTHGHRSRARTVALIPPTLLFLLAGLSPGHLAQFGTALAPLASAPLHAQEDGDDAPWDVTAPRGQTREIDFTTSEGTWMSVDLSADGDWVVFDLLGHIYRVAAGGGEAVSLTQSSGVAVNFHPRFSPDGATIAFISDRGGQNNLWLMDADGSNPRPVFEDQALRAAEPAWSPDGRFIVVRRSSTEREAGGAGLWMYSRDGGEGVELVGSDFPGAAWPAFSPDGGSLYFQLRTAPPGVWSGRSDVMQGFRQIRRLDLETGRVDEVTAGQAVQQGQTSSGGAIAPEPSPDGRWLAFGRRIPDGTISHKGLRFGPRTALWLRDLTTGAERVVMDPIEVDMAEGMKVSRDLPGYAWSRDSRSIVIPAGGKIRRLDIESGEVATINFDARVHRVISEMAGRPQEPLGTTFTVQFPRWTASSPDGSRLAFHAVGRIWVMNLPDGTPARLTGDALDHSEVAPAWSPDGSAIAFTSWEPNGRGHIWRVAANGGAPEQLTTVEAEYMNTAWSPDGGEIVATRGAGATNRGRTVASNEYFEFVAVPAEGGDVRTIGKVARPYTGGRPMMPRRPPPQGWFGPDGRLFYAEALGPMGDDPARTEIASIEMDGTGRRVHFTLPDADEAAVSPDGRWLAFQEGDNVYRMPFPYGGTGSNTVRIAKRNGQLPVTQVSLEGGIHPRWRDAETLEFVSGPRYYAHNVDTGETLEVPIRLELPRHLASGAVAFTGARIVTVENDVVVENGTLVATNGRLTCVGQCDTSGADRVFDATGKTIIPGLIDMHAHHHRDHLGLIPLRNWESAIYLAYGVTTTLDNSQWSANVFPAAELVESGRMIGPRVYSTGDPVYAGDGARQNEITSYEAADRNVARLMSWGAVSIKEYMQPRRIQRQWVTEAARVRGLRVTAEGGDIEYNLGMIMDGHTGWEHPMSYTPLYSDVARFFGQAEAVYSPTFMVGGPGPWNEEYFYQEYEVWKDPKMRRWLPWRMLVPVTRRRMLRPGTDYSYPLIARGLGDMIEEGGWGAIGAHGQLHGLGPHYEVWMVAAGTDEHTAIEVATIHGAHFLGLEHELGSLAQGKIADFVVLNANPLDDIRATADIAWVIKDGIVYNGETLDELWPAPRPFGEHYWVDEDALRGDNRPTDYWNRVRPGPPPAAQPVRSPAR